MEKMIREEFEVLIDYWETAIESERNAYSAGIETEEFLDNFYKVIEILAAKLFGDKIEDIFEYMYGDNEVSLEELYDIVYEG